MVHIYALLSNGKLPRPSPRNQLVAFEHDAYDTSGLFVNPWFAVATIVRGKSAIHSLFKNRSQSIELTSCLRVSSVCLVCIIIASEQGQITLCTCTRNAQECRKGGMEYAPFSYHGSNGLFVGGSVWSVEHDLEGGHNWKRHENLFFFRLEF